MASGSSKKASGRSLAQQPEGALPLAPRALPEGQVGEVDLVEAEHGFGDHGPHLTEGSGAGPRAGPAPRPGRRSLRPGARPGPRRSGRPRPGGARGRRAGVAQSTDSGRPPRGPPLGRRASSTRAATVSSPAGREAAMRSRSQRARAGLAPAGGDGHRHRPPIGGRRASATVPGPVAVGAVDQHAGGPGVGHDGAVHRRVAGGGDHQVEGGRLALPVGAALHRGQPRRRRFATIAGLAPPRRPPRSPGPRPPAGRGPCRRPPVRRPPPGRAGRPGPAPPGSPVGPAGPRPGRLVAGAGDHGPSSPDPGRPGVRRSTPNGRPTLHFLPDWPGFS